MFDWELDYLARKERIKDLMRDAEQAQRIDTAQPGANIARWLGKQMIKWGSKL